MISDDRRYSGSGLLRRGGRESWFSGLFALGSDLLHWWEVPDASSPLITLNAGNVSQLNDRVGGAHAAQGGAGSQPAYSAAGGPAGKPCIDLQDGARQLIATLPAYAAGNRVGIYVVCKAAGSGVDTQVAAIYPDGGEAVAYYSSFTGSLFKLYLDHDGAPSFNGNLTSPAFDANWHLRAVRPLADGSLSQIDGATTTPNPAGDGLIAFDRAIIGTRHGNSGGSVAAMFLVSDPTSAKDAIVRAYVAAQFGIGP